MNRILRNLIVFHSNSCLKLSKVYSKAVYDILCMYFFSEYFWIGKTEEICNSPKKKEQHNTDSTPHYNTYQDFFCGFFLIYNHFESKIRIITIINTGFPYDIIQAIIVKTNCHERYLFKNRTKKHRNSQIHRSKPLK